MVSRDKLNEQLQAFDFDSLARKQSNAQRRLRLLGVAHLKEGKSYVVVAHSLRVTRHAVMRWADWFATDGIERLSGIAQSGRPSRLGNAQEEAVRCAIEQARGGGRIRGEEIRQLLHEQFDVDYRLNGVYHLLERLGMSWISARATSPQADLPAQAAFKKIFVLPVQSVVPPHVASEQVDLWFQNEMRLGQRGTQTRRWARKGTRPRVVRQ